MNYCLCSFSTANRKNLYGITNLCKRCYAEKYNVDFIFEELSNYRLHPAWYKMDFILKLFEKYDAVYFLDDDASFIRYDVNLYSLLDTCADINIAHVDDSLNTGSFFLKKNANTIEMLKYVYMLYDKYKDDIFLEQSAFNDAIEKFKLKVNLLDDKIINSTIFNRTADSVILHLMGKVKVYFNDNFMLNAFGVI
jgi:hypothetical protein